MPIRFACPVCKSVMKVPHAAAGKKGDCPNCGQRLQIPAPPNRTVLGEPLPAQPARLPDPHDPSPEAMPAGPPAWPNAYSVLGSFLGFAALPIGLSLAKNWVGAFVGGIGFLLAAWGFLVALRRWAAVGKALIGFVFCASVLFVAVVLGGGWRNLLAEAGASFVGRPKAQNQEEEHAERDGKPPANDAETPRDQTSASNDMATSDKGKSNPEPPTAERTLANLVRSLGSKDANERIRAANSIARMGSQGKPAARALCEMALSTTAEVRQAA